MLFRRCLRSNRQAFPFGEIKSVVDFNRKQWLHMSKINLLKKTGHEASFSVAVWEEQGELNPDLEPFNPPKKKVKTRNVNQKIGYGYLLAIGIAFLGSLSGLVIADYYQGQGLKQLNDAHLQAQLLGNFQDATLAAQLQGSQLDYFVDNSIELKQQEEQLVKSIVQAKNLRLRIEKFADSQPAWLAAKPEVLKFLLQDGTKNLEAYADTLKSTLQKIQQSQ